MGPPGKMDGNRNWKMLQIIEEAFTITTNSPEDIWSIFVKLNCSGCKATISILPSKIERQTELHTTKYYNNPLS